jgi:hypothetical protein
VCPFIDDGYSTPYKKGNADTQWCNKVFKPQRQPVLNSADAEAGNIGFEIHQHQKLPIDRVVQEVEFGIKQVGNYRNQDKEKIQKQEGKKDHCLYGDELGKENSSHRLRGSKDLLPGIVSVLNVYDECRNQYGINWPKKYTGQLPSHTEELCPGIVGHRFLGGVIAGGNADGKHQGNKEGANNAEPERIGAFGF